MDSKPRTVIATFYADDRGRLSMDSLTVITSNGTDYYDVDWSRAADAYLFHMSGASGRVVAPEISGIYFFSGEPASVVEIPSNLADERARERNRTRPLRRLPGQFTLYPGWDLLDWLEQYGIAGDAVWCATCRDFLPEEDLCSHTWWCNRTDIYSTPDDRCACADRDECNGGGE